MRLLLIDAQVAHTMAMHRGMGKYSQELLNALAMINKDQGYWDRIELIVSSKIPLDQGVREYLSTIMHIPKLIELPLKKDLIYGSQAISHYNRKIIDSYIEQQEQDTSSLNVDFLILSPMQGGVCSVYPSMSRVHKAAIFYDLIPFMFHNIYYANPVARTENLTKLVELLRADSFLTISKTVANDLAVYLGLDPQRISNIDGGPINHSSSPKAVTVPDKYILMPTGNDVRKNNLMGVLGFEKFNRQHDEAYTLVVTSFFEPSEITELSSKTSKVVFTGNISGDELEYLYDNCEGLLFPSIYEGLGLPILEAVEKYKPVACSDISVFREMSSTAFSYFNPNEPDSITNALNEMITKDIIKSEYSSILSKYNWTRTAELASKTLTNHKYTAYVERYDVSMFGVNPECNLASGRVMQSAYAEMSLKTKPTYYIESGGEDSSKARPNLLQHVEGAVNISNHVAIKLRERTLPVYNLVNTSANAKTLFTALANPGLLILYDLDLTRTWDSLLDKGIIDKSRLQLEAKLQNLISSNSVRMLCSVIANQKAIAVFSKHAKDIIDETLKKLGRAIPVSVIPYPASSLVYDDILPDKEATLVSFNNLAYDNAIDIYITDKQDISNGGRKELGDKVSVSNDYDIEDYLSRASRSMYSNNEQYEYALAGMRYGTIPTYLKVVKGLDLLRELPKVSTTLTSLSQLKELSLSAPETLRKTAQAEVRERHSYKEFADSVYKIIEEIKDRE